MQPARSVLWVITACIAYTSLALANESLTRFQKRDQIDFLATADSLEALVESTEPLATWGIDARGRSGVNMVWVFDSPATPLRFIFNQAAHSADGRWVLARRSPDVAPLPSLSIQFSYCEMTLVDKPPQSDGGGSPHALVVQKNEHGTLYRARWGTEPCLGSGLYYTLRDVFLFQSADGQWSLIGQGADQTQGRRGGGTYFNQDVEYRYLPAEGVIGKVRITATKSNRVGWLGDLPPSSSANRDLVSYREGTLDIRSREMSWGKHEYVRLEAGDTLWKMAERVTRWNHDYLSEHPERWQALQQPVLDLIRKLNPKSASRGAPQIGERILIPSYAEIQTAQKGSPATQPIHTLKSR